MARTLGVWGHPQACTDQLLDLIGCGVDLLILNTVGDERNQLDVLTADVLPVLRHAAETPPAAGPANLPITS
jgi:hypothetical protein